MSEPLKFNKTDMYKVFMGLVIALAGAGLTYIETTIPDIDFGKYTTLAMFVVNSGVVNFLRKLLTRTGT